MMLAYAKTGRLELALDSMRALMGFASIWRMDSPLVSWGSAVYQPGDPINTVYDMFGVPSALLRMIWDPEYSATTLTLTPHVPGNFTALAQLFPLRWGTYQLYISCTGTPAAGISGVRVNGVAISSFTPTSVELAWADMPKDASNVTVELSFSSGSSSEAGTAPLPLPSLGEVLRRPHTLTVASAVRALRSLMPQDALLWLDASTLALADGASIAQWPDQSGNKHDAAQARAAARPTFRKGGAAHGLPAVSFDGAATFLQNPDMPLPSRSTMFAVFRDHGTLSNCCTGVFFSLGGCNGLGTKMASMDDDSDASVLMMDWSGSPDSGMDDIRGRQVTASVVYNNSGAFSFADTCPQSMAGVVGAAGAGFMVGSRNNELGRFLNGTLSELIVFARPLNGSEMEAVHAYLMAKWPSDEPKLSCTGPPPNCTLPAALAAAAARLGRFVPGMRAALFSDGIYELAHALLALEAVAVWQARCSGLTAGTIAPLASRGSEQAANALYVSTASNLASGLATVLDAYAGSTDPQRQQIYEIWAATA